MAPVVRRRCFAAAVVALAFFTLAPRTSEHLENGWEVWRIAETAARDRGGVSVVTFQATPPDPAPATSRLPIFVAGGDWELVAAPPGCTDEGVAVVCMLDAGDIRSNHVITVAVRSDVPVSFSFVPPGT
jgi:hypothetical protein